MPSRGFPTSVYLKSLKSFLLRLPKIMRKIDGSAYVHVVRLFVLRIVVVGSRKGQVKLIIAVNSAVKSKVYLRIYFLLLRIKNSVHL